VFHFSVALSIPNCPFVLPASCIIWTLKWGTEKKGRMRWTSRRHGSLSSFPILAGSGAMAGAALPTASSTIGGADTPLLNCDGGIWKGRWWVSIWVGGRGQFIAGGAAWGQLACQLVISCAGWWRWERRVGSAEGNSRGLLHQVGGRGSLLTVVLV